LPTELGTRIQFAVAVAVTMVAELKLGRR